MVGGYGGLERGVDEDFAVWIDLEDGAAAVADEEVSIAVECGACGDTHSFGVDGELACGIDAVDVALGARGDEEVAVGVEGEPGGVENAFDVGSASAVRADADYGDGGGLAALAGDGGVDHSRGAHRGTGDRVQSGVELAGDAKRSGIARPGDRADFHHSG